MENGNQMEQLRATIKRMPRGWKQLVTEGNANKDAIFYRMIKKNSPAEFTSCEVELFNKLIDVIEDFNNNNKILEQRMKKVLQ